MRAPAPRATARDGRPYLASTVHADELLWVTDVVCAARPPAIGHPESAATVEVVLPIRGLFVRRVARRGREREILGDPATALVFRPDEPFRVSHPLGGADRSVAIALRPAALESLGLRPGDLPDVVRTGTAVDLLLRRWLRGLRSGILDELGAAETAAVILDHLLGPAPRAATGPVADRLADAVRLELAEHLGERVTLPVLAARVGVSGFHLARRFRAATGTTIHAWRTTLRLREALRRIDGGERDLTALALDLGFAHHSHLSNAIRSTTGRPPSAFRLGPTAAEIADLRTILQA